MKSSIAISLLLTPTSLSFSPSHIRNPTPSFLPKTHRPSLHQLLASKIGVFYGTSTGSTESSAYVLCEEFGPDLAEGPFEIDALQGDVAKKFGEYDVLIVGAPTWNTGADTERSGTGWDEIYYGEMQNLKIDGKKVAVFGHGDSVSYAENYSDAAGELHDVFENLGCKMMGYTSTEGYLHEESKAVKGDKFCGLLLDSVNQEELTEGRVKAWVKQLNDEGLLSTGGDAAVSTPEVVSTPSAVSTPEVSTPSDSVQDDSSRIIAELQKENSELRKMMEENGRESNADLSEVTIQAFGGDSEGFVPHFNKETRRTMWTSPDGRYCYFTDEASVVSP